MTKAYRATLLQRQWAEHSKVFTALGDQHRQRIVLLFERGEELTIKDIVDAFGLSRTAMAHHIRVLREAGVIIGEKRGKEVYLRLNPQHVMRDWVR